VVLVKRNKEGRHETKEFKDEIKVVRKGRNPANKNMR
jgi:hypothetical protein